MTSRHHKSSIYLTLIAGIACALLAIALLPLLTQTALADLPPRPTPRPTPAPFPPPPPPSTGGWIELRVATSEPFYLPDSSGGAVTVEVSPVP